MKRQADTRTTETARPSGEADAITAGMKVAEVVRARPQTVDVFFRYGCPDMRGGFFGLMARMMSVRNAARVHRLPLADLLADLNACEAEGPAA